jgi:hypothetical protein
MGLWKIQIDVMRWVEMAKGNGCNMRRVIMDKASIGGKKRKFR